jgi:hypothetical protein
MSNTGSTSRARLNFRAVSDAALPKLPALLARWLPDGRREGSEWVARNPTRADKHPGSFKVNLRSGRWADFATGATGGDAISLAAHLHGLSQLDAARQLAGMLGISPKDGR